MPRLLVLNPNRSTWMTDRVLARLRHMAPAAWAIEGSTAADGPEVICDEATFVAGADAAGRLWSRQIAAGALPDAALLACFGDPGLEALRAAQPGIRIEGLAHAGLHEAVALHGRCAIVTCGPAWVPLLRERAQQWQLGAALVGVYALPVNGREFALNPAPWKATLLQAALQARSQGAAALVLGGAAFAGLEEVVDWPLPVIDPIASAERRLMGGSD